MVIWYCKGLKSAIKNLNINRRKSSMKHPTKNEIIGTLLLLLVFAIVGLMYWFSGYYKRQAKASSPAKVTLCSGLSAEEVAQKAKEENERLTNQIIADGVVRDIIYIQDPRTGLTFAYNKSSGSIAHITGYSLPGDLYYVAKVSDKK
jgi:hypothetical protein